MTPGRQAAPGAIVRAVRPIAFARTARSGGAPALTWRTRSHRGVAPAEAARGRAGTTRTSKVPPPASVASEAEAGSVARPASSGEGTEEVEESYDYEYEYEYDAVSEDEAEHAEWRAGQNVWEKSPTGGGDRGDEEDGEGDDEGQSEEVSEGGSEEEEGEGGRDGRWDDEEGGWEEADWVDASSERSASGASASTSAAGEAGTSLGGPHFVSALSPSALAEAEAAFALTAPASEEDGAPALPPASRLETAEDAERAGRLVISGRFAHTIWTPGLRSRLWAEARGGIARSEDDALALTVRAFRLATPRGPARRGQGERDKLVELRLETRRHGVLRASAARSRFFEAATLAAQQLSRRLAGVRALEAPFRARSFGDLERYRRGWGPRGTNRPPGWESAGQWRAKMADSTPAQVAWDAAVHAAEVRAARYEARRAFSADPVAFRRTVGLADPSGSSSEGEDKDEGSW